MGLENKEMKSGLDIHIEIKINMYFGRFLKQGEI